jgi:hypothetical protein
VVSASDNVAVTAVALYSGTTKLGNLTKNADGTWRGTFNAASYPNGNYLVSARATDAAGNVGNSPAISLTVLH